MERLLQDLRLALRSLARQRGFTTVAVVTLALGIGATTAIFSVVQSVLLRPLPYTQPERLVTVWQEDAREPRDEIGGVLSHPDFKDLRQRSRSFDAMALYSSASITVSGLGDAEVVRGAIVTPDFFRVFDAQPVMGRGFTAEEDLPGGPRAVVVSYGFWQDRLGGAADVLDRTLTISGRELPIVGVTPADFAYPADARLYLTARNDDASCGRGCVYLSGVARLSAGVTPAQARRELKGIAAQLEVEYPSSNTNSTVQLATLHEETVQGVERALVVLLGAVAMVLLIACANVANLLLVRGAARSGEMAVRAVLGGSRPRLISQLMTESVVLAVLGGAAGVLLAAWGIAALRVLAPPDLPRVDEIALNGVTMLFTSGLVLATALLFGLAPALRLARTSLGSTIREGGRGAGGGPRSGLGRRTILIAEVALSVLLLIGAGLMIRSFVQLQEIDTGFSKDEAAMFTVALPDARYGDLAARTQFFEELKQRLERTTGGEVGRVTPVPLGAGVVVSSLERTDVPAPEPGEEPIALLRVADPDFFEVYDITLQRGRVFEETDRIDAPRVVVISRTLAERFFANEDPIGRQIDVGVAYGVDEDQPRTIIGIVENIRSVSLTEPAMAEMYVPLAQAVPNATTYVVRAPDAAAALQSARTELRDMDAALPLIRPGTMSELIGAHTAGPTFYVLLLGLFALLAVVLAAVGMYGVVAYLVVQRTREIGVRMALGAHPRQVVRLVVGQGMKPALVGVAVGVTGAIASGRVIASMLYETAPQDPLTYASVVGLLTLVVVAACALPAWRATRIPPSIALRGE
jgi:putative ABC transport system permease protein